MTLETQKGRAEIVAFYWSPEASQSYIEKVVKTASQLTDKIHINVLTVVKNVDKLLKLQAENPELLTVYIGDGQIE